MELYIFSKNLMTAWRGKMRRRVVVIEGVSLISNYRSQFREIMANKGTEALIDTLRKKQIGKKG
jgi:ABC-type transporter MlaC component